MVQFDPGAAVGRWDIEIELGGRSWTVAARPAADWVPGVVGDSPELIIPGMVEEDPGPLEDAILDGEVDAAALRRAARDAVEAAAGVRWWIARRLLATAMEWEGVGGELILQGLRLDQDSLGQVCAACWRAAIRNIDQKQRNRLIVEIERPPRGVAAEEVYDEHEALADLQRIPSD